MHVLYLCSQEIYGCLVPCFLHYSTILSCVCSAHISRIHIICSIFIFIYTHSIYACGWMVFCSDANFLSHRERHIFSCYLISLGLPSVADLLTHKLGSEASCFHGLPGMQLFTLRQRWHYTGSHPLANEDTVMPSWLCLGKCDFYGWFLIHRHSWHQCKVHFAPLWSCSQNSVPASFLVTL